MKILLDECIPQKLRNSLTSYDCRCVSKEGWTGKKNGELLTLAERAGFQVFLTIDHGIEFQQNLAFRNIAIVLIHSNSSRLADLTPHVPEIVRALESVQPGRITKVG